MTLAQSPLQQKVVTPKAALQELFPHVTFEGGEVKPDPKSPLAIPERTPEQLGEVAAESRSHSCNMDERGVGVEYGQNEFEVNQATDHSDDPIAVH